MPPANNEGSSYLNLNWMCPPGRATRIENAPSVPLVTDRETDTFLLHHLQNARRQTRNKQEFARHGGA